MSGPRRRWRQHSRRSAAACLFFLLVLAFALVRGGAASAHGDAGRRHHPAGLLGGVGKIVTKVGHQVDSVLTGVGTLLGDRPAGHQTTPPSSSPPSSSPAPNPTATPTKPHPTPTRPTRPAANPPAAHSSTSRGHQVVGRLPVPRKASPVATSSRAPTPKRTHVVPDATDPQPSAIPELDITAALAALMFATVLGVGLVVYRAGYRGVRAH